MQKKKSRRTAAMFYCFNFAVALESKAAVFVWKIKMG